MALPKLELPKHKTTLPSDGREIIMRPYTVKEEKLLLLALESQDAEQITMAISSLLEACIETELEMSDLAGYDVEKIFLELRGISVGETIQFMAKCQHCDHDKNEVSVDIKDIKISDWNPDDKVIKLSDTVGITMMHPTTKTLLKMSGEHAIETVEGIMELIIASVQNIFDEDNVYKATDDNQDEIKEFIEGLSTEQFKKVGNFFNSMPMLTYDMEYECDKCGKENKIELRGLQSFFT